MAHILIIDDDPDIRDLLSVYLESEGHALSHAENGQDGIEQAQSSTPDLIILDINMPVMDGLKLISLIRGEQNLSRMPICVITTEGAKEDRERAITLGANEYLTKPIQANKVLAVAKSLLKLAD